MATMPLYSIKLCLVLHFVHKFKETVSATAGLMCVH